jgi:hypothetical protein
MAMPVAAVTVARSSPTTARQAWRSGRARSGPMVSVAATVVVALALGLATFAYRYLSFSGFANDHFVHLTMAQQITMGDLPVRDYVERGMPLMAGVSALAQTALGPGLLSELTLVAAAFAAAAVFLYIVAARLAGSVLAGLIAASATVLVYPASYSHPKLLVYALTFVAALVYAVRPSTARLALVALTVVIAFLFRHDHGGFVAAGAAVMLLALHGPARAGLVSVGRLAALCALWASPYLVWVEIHDSVPLYAADGLEFFRREAERSSFFGPPAFGVDRDRPLFTHVDVPAPIVNVRWRADLPEAAIAERERQHQLVRQEEVGPQTWQYELRVWSSSALAALVRDPAAADTHGIDRERYRVSGDDSGPLDALWARLPRPGAGLRIEENAVAALFYLSWAVPVLALGALFIARDVPPWVRALTIMAAVVQLAMNVTMLRDPLALRIRDVVAPLPIALAFLVSGAWTDRHQRPVRWTLKSASALLLATTVAAAAGVGAVGDRLNETGALAGWQGIQDRRAELAAEFGPPRHRTGRVRETYLPLVDYVAACTPPASRVLAMTFVPEVLFYAGRGYAGGQVAMTPGYWVSDRHATLMLDRLSREDVPFVILDDETEAEMTQQYPRVMQRVRAAYHEIAEFPLSGSKKLVLLGEYGRAPVRSFGADSLPCYA